MNQTDWNKLSILFSDALSSQSHQTQFKALTKFSQLSKEAPESALIPTIPFLIHLLSTTHDPSLQLLAARSLSSLSRRPSLSAAIGQTGAIPVLLRRLQATCSTKCLSRLVAFDRPNRVVLARSRGLPVVIDAIRSSNSASRRYLLEILTALAMLREVRRVLVGFGGLEFVVEAVGNGRMVSRIRASQAIGLLGIAKRIRHMLVDLGAVDALVGLMRDADEAGRIVAGNALGVVSSYVGYLRLAVQAGAIPLYIDLLHGPEPLGKEIVEDVFCILAVAEENAVSIVDHLVSVLTGNGGEDVKGAALDVIWDIALYKYSVSVVRNSGAIPILIGFIRDGISDLREKALRAVSQLSYEEENREAMEEEEGTIPLLILLLKGDSDELREYAAETLICFAEDPRYREHVSEVFEIPSFLVIKERLSRISAAEERMSRSMGLITLEDLDSDLDFDV